MVKTMVARRPVLGFVFYPVAMVQAGLQEPPCEGRLRFVGSDVEFLVSNLGEMEVAMNWLQQQPGVYQDHAGFFVNLPEEATTEEAERRDPA